MPYFILDVERLNCFEKNYCNSREYMIKLDITNKEDIENEKHCCQCRS